MSLPFSQMYHCSRTKPVLTIIGNQEGQVREITPKVMSLLKGRLEHVFLRLSSTMPSDPALRNISNMTSLTQRITDSMRPLAANSSY